MMTNSRDLTNTVARMRQSFLRDCLNHMQRCLELAADYIKELEELLPKEELTLEGYEPLLLVSFDVEEGETHRHTAELLKTMSYIRKLEKKLGYTYDDFGNLKDPSRKAERLYYQFRQMLGEEKSLAPQTERGVTFAPWLPYTLDDRLRDRARWFVSLDEDQIEQLEQLKQLRQRAA